MSISYKKELSFLLLLFFISASFFYNHSNLVFADTTSSSSSGSCEPGEVGVYSIPTAGSDARSIVKGSDGNLWFTENLRSKIGKITTDGIITEYNTLLKPVDITAGTDGNLWFTKEVAVGSNGDKIGRITTNGEVSDYSISPSGFAYKITTGSDGNIWFTEESQNKLGRITTGGLNQYDLASTLIMPSIIAAGPDGNIWFGTTFLSINQIQKINNDGIVSTVTNMISASVSHATSGPDMALWFIESGNNTIGMVSTSADLTEFNLLPSVSPTRITTGPDGNLWFTAGDKIGKITTGGAVSTYNLPSGSSSYAIALGIDNNLWFTDPGRNSIVKFSLCKPVSTSSSSSSSSSGASSSGSTSSSSSSTNSSSSSSGASSSGSTSSSSSSTSSSSSSSGNSNSANSSSSSSSSSSGSTISPTIANFNLDFSGLWKGVIKIASQNSKKQSKLVTLKLCIKDRELKGSINVTGIINNSEIVSQDVKSENEVNINITDKNGKTNSINLKLVNRQLSIEIKDIGNLLARKIKTVKQCQ